jgi:hypothetical protein
MNRSFSLILSALLLCIPAAAMPARAMDTTAERDFSQETPLMVIRFNQAHVDYPMPLYDTISRALKVKPGAVFDLVSVAPRARESHNQPYYNRMAEQNSHKVLSTLHQIGLPASRISIVSAIDSVNASEVRIYVH